MQRVWPLVAAASDDRFTNATSLRSTTDVDPQVRLLLDRWAAAVPAGKAEGVEVRTAASVRRDDEATLELQAPAMSMRDIHDVVIAGGQDGLNARVYVPGPNPSRTLLYLHGGGFVLGPIGYDEPLRRLAAASGCRIVALHQRLAPEHAFPAAIDDALTAARWLLNRWSSDVASERMPGVVGDSSGGNLAAVVTHELANEGVPLAFQVLIYPMLDALASSGSYRDLATGYGFTREKSLWYFDQYLPSTVDRRDPRVSPLCARDLHDLPPTLVITADCDPLRDEGLAYARKLTEQGVQVEHWPYPGMIHGFFQMSGALDAARRLHEELGAWIAAQ
jgi:acetyl esterase